MTLDSSLPALMTGVFAGVLIFKNRGGYYYDAKRKIRVSDGDGLNTRIIKRWPEYRLYSSAVDHVLEGISLTLFVGSVVDIVQPDTIMQTTSPYTIGALVAFAKKTIHMGEAIGSGRNLDRGDAYQAFADVTSVAGTWAFMQYVVNRV